MKALLLVGGMGTRLRPVLPSTPKALAEVGGQPFLELLIRHLGRHGIREFVLCTGHLADKIEERLGDGSPLGVDITYSQELQPLGTGGAVKFARKHLEGAESFWVMNGDSFVDADFRRLEQFHKQHGGIMTMAAVEVPNANRYGALQLDGAGRVLSFAEKASGEQRGLVNAGVYIFDHAILDRIPDGVSSLERDLFPKLLAGGIYALPQTRTFIDIGTPDDYQRAQDFLRQIGGPDQEAARPGYFHGI